VEIALSCLNEHLALAKSDMISFSKSSCCAAAGYCRIPQLPSFTKFIAFENASSSSPPPPPPPPP
jgi:hypothetical protein